MKKLLYIIGSILFLVSCSKDAEIITEDYPFLIMESATVLEKTVVLEAKILNIDEVDVTSFGFLWDTSNKLNFSTSFVAEVEEIDESGRFSFIIESDLYEDENYFVRPFVKYAGKTVYGNEGKFVSCETEEPAFLDFFPKQGFSGDTVRVKGIFFSHNKSRVKVWLGSDEAQIVSTRNDEVVFVVPQNLTFSGYVKINVSSGNYNLESDGLFSIQGHRVTGFFPESGLIGEAEVTIEGFGFGDDPGEIVVKIGENLVDLISISDAEIRVRLPYVMESGSFTISVQKSQMVTNSVETFDVVSRWTRLDDFPGQTSFRDFFILVGNIGYLITGTEVWIYHIENGSWERISDFPGLSRVFAVGFINNNYLYFGLGSSGYSNNLKDFWRFDIESQVWVQLDDFPGFGRSSSIFFTMENKGYIIGGAGQSYNRQVWSFNFIDETWTFKGNAPENILIHYESSNGIFEFQNKIYIFRSSTLPYLNENTLFLFEFDPDHDGFLKPVHPYPLAPVSYGLPCLVIDNDIFVFHQINNYPPAFIYKYSLETDSWKIIESFPERIQAAGLWFSKNGLAYFLFMRQMNFTVGKDIWVFDPNTSP